MKRSNPGCTSLSSARAAIDGWRRAAAAVFLTVLFAGPTVAQTPSAERGRYIFDAAGCYGCHTAADGVPLAGGPPLVTPFGTFYAPNITPDPETGIGKWSSDDFVRAMREGLAPSGDRYFPVFPYTSFTKMTPADILDLKAYLDTIAPVKKANRDHEVAFPFSLRTALIPWEWLNFEAGTYVPDTSRDEKWNRGAYLVQALAHCGECHTPRNWLGGLDRTRWMSGARMPNGDLIASNLTPDKSGLADWSEDDIVELLATGTLPQGGSVGGEMAEVVKHGTSRMRPEDREAIAAYLKSLPPLPQQVEKK